MSTDVADTTAEPRPSHYVVEWVDATGPHELPLASRRTALRTAAAARPACVCAVFLGLAPGGVMVETRRELVQAFDARVCRVCGCNDGRACAGGCTWVEPDLCSACVDPRPRGPLVRLLDRWRAGVVAAPDRRYR